VDQSKIWKTLVYYDWINHNDNWITSTRFCSKWYVSSIERIPIQSGIAKVIYSWHVYLCSNNPRLWAFNVYYLRLFLDWRAGIPKGASDLDIFFQHVVFLWSYPGVRNRCQDNWHDVQLELEDLISLTNGPIYSPNQLRLVSKEGFI
jgi:hypothetical protein